MLSYEISNAVMYQFWYVCTFTCYSTYCLAKLDIKNMKMKRKSRVINFFQVLSNKYVILKMRVGKKKKNVSKNE